MLQLKLNEENIVKVDYKLKSGVIATLSFENGELIDISGMKNEEKCECKNKNEVRQPLATLPKIPIDKFDTDKAKELMGLLNPVKNTEKEDEKIKLHKPKFDEFIKEWEKTDRPYYDRLDKIKNDMTRDKLLADFIMRNEKLFKQGKIKELLLEIINSEDEGLTPTEIRNAFIDESIDRDMLKKIYDYKDEIMKDVKKDLDNSEEKEIFKEMANKYTPEQFSSKDCMERPKLEEYRKKKGFPDAKDEKKVIIENKKDIEGKPIGPIEGVDINGKQVVIKEFTTNVDDYGKNL